MAGFDWLVIDHEHGPFELRDIVSIHQALAAHDVATVVRPVSHDPFLLKKLLDIGVQSYVVPMVETAEQAEAIVRALRYPPGGERGVGTALARAARWNQVPDYLKRANDEICLIVQVESVLAMENLDEILAVEGVDGVLIGPSDLAASMGYIGESNNPDVGEAINRTLGRVSAAGKHAGIFCLNPELIAGFKQLGVNFAGIGAETLLLANASRELLQDFKAKQDEGGEGGGKIGY